MTTTIYYDNLYFIVNVFNVFMMAQMLYLIFIFYFSNVDF